jgi:hypothetical protein
VGAATAAATTSLCSCSSSIIASLLLVKLLKVTTTNPWTFSAGRCKTKFRASSRRRDKRFPGPENGGNWP